MQAIVERFRTFLGGYKTYIAAASLLLIAILGFINGELTAIKAAELMAEALGLGGLRAGIKTALESLIAKAAVQELKK